MKYRCKCPPDSPFHWRDDKSPTIFQDKAMKQSVASSMSQTAVVERERLNGRDISHFPGMKVVVDRVNLKQFSVYSRAVPSK